jgi:hypothetical protein
MALGVIVVIVVGATSSACGTTSAAHSTPSKSIELACNRLGHQGTERADSDGYAYIYDIPSDLVGELHNSGSASLSNVGTVLAKASQSGNSALFNANLSRGKSLCRSLGS